MSFPLQPGRLLQYSLVLLALHVPASHARMACCAEAMQADVAADVAAVKAPAVADRWQWLQSGGQISMQQAIRIAKRQFPGRVLSAKRSVNRQGDVVYRIKILSNSGQIRTITVAANQGRG